MPSLYSTVLVLPMVWFSRWTNLVGPCVSLHNACWMLDCYR